MPYEKDGRVYVIDANGNEVDITPRPIVDETIADRVRRGRRSCKRPGWDY